MQKNHVKTSDQKHARKRPFKEKAFVPIRGERCQIKHIEPSPVVTGVGIWGGKGGGEKGGETGSPQGENDGGIWGRAQHYSMKKKKRGNMSNPKFGWGGGRQKELEAVAV